MAVDSYMIFEKYDSTWLEAESQVDFGSSSSDKIGKPFLTRKGNVFEVDTFSFDVEQTINMSSQSMGAGAGKIAFNPFKITRKIDKATPLLFQMACQGKTFKNVSLGFRKAAGIDASGLFFLRFDFAFVAIKTLNWSHGDDSPTEDLELEYGALGIVYGLQNQDGTIEPQSPRGWDKIKNVDNSEKVKVDSLGSG